MSDKIPAEEDPKFKEGIERLVLQYGEDAVLRYIKKRKRRGRPALADEVALSEMASLQYKGIAKNSRQAAISVINTVEGDDIDEESKIRRLCRKFQKQKAELMSEAERQYRASTDRAATPIKRRTISKLPSKFSIEELKSSLLNFAGESQKSEERLKSILDSVDKMYQEQLCRFQEQLRVDQSILNSFVMPDLERAQGIIQETLSKEWARLDKKTLNFVPWEDPE